MYKQYASVILELSIDKTLDYGIPSNLIDVVVPGLKVRVPMRNKYHTGFVVKVKEKPDFTPVKPLHSIHQDTLIQKDIFQLALWMAKYYSAPLHKVFKVILPSSVRKETKHKEQYFVMRAITKDMMREMCCSLREKAPAQVAILEAMLLVKKGMLLTELLSETNSNRASVQTLVKKGALLLDIVRVDRSPLVNEEYFPTLPKKLNDEQQIALDRLKNSSDQNQFQSHLLYGITGSGKTEVYLQAISHVLNKGKATIVLVPEISLTAQMIERFRSRFDQNIAILHYRLSHGERYDEWKRIERGEAKIVIGPRSAIFSPVQDLGLIIVDEEHENTYKQAEESPYYHARDVAVMRGYITQCPVVLGSATPSLESTYNALSGKYQISTLSARADAANLPDVKIIDMQREYEKAKGFTIFSDALLNGIKNRHDKGEQTILFLNRRGYHTAFFCQDCREAINCKHCDVALTYHRKSSELSCHLCGYTLSALPNSCPTCGKNKMMKFRGVGTEQVERALHAIFPDIRTMRIDADTTKHKGSHQKYIREFGSGKADVLVGTQMIAKGLHFPQVTLVGVLNCDGPLNIPDFRSSETIFQLITQVSGRAGRGSIKGNVILQTSMPDNQTILHAAKQDFWGFYEDEIQIRELFHYPPFTHLIKISLTGEKEKDVVYVLNKFRKTLLKEISASFEVMPVTPSGYAKVKDRYRYQFITKGSSIYQFNQVFQKVREEFCFPRTLKLSVDVDPLSTFF